jgi:hypothetical protein
MNIEKNDFPNFGYLTADFPKDVLVTLSKRIDKLIKDPSHAIDYSNRLVANIKHSYDISDCKNLIEPCIIELVKEYDNAYPGYTRSRDCVSTPTPIGIHDVWVNFQRPGEVNPNHSHPGIFSFVIWMYVPYLLEDQQQDLPGAPINGLFEFTYTQATGVINHVALPSDKSWQGKCCLFPSPMQHCVYPFNSDNPKDLRITVAGNVRFLTE